MIGGHPSIFGCFNPMFLVFEKELWPTYRRKRLFVDMPRSILETGKGRKLQELRSEILGRGHKKTTSPTKHERRQKESKTVLLWLALLLNKTLGPFSSPQQGALGHSFHRQDRIFLRPAKIEWPLRLESQGWSVEGASKGNNGSSGFSEKSSYKGTAAQR